MSDIKTLSIDGRKYQLVVMAPWDGAEFAAEVAGLLTGALAGEASEAKDLSDIKGEIAGGGMSEGMIKRIPDMVMRILPHIKPREFTRLARQSFRDSELSVGGDKLSEEGLFDQHFGKHRGDYFPVAVWAIKENCAGFFVGGGQGWAALGAQFLPSKSQTDG
jgi:hypothetical protein